MRHPQELTPFPPAVSTSPRAAWRIRRLSPLARDIVVILLVKAVVLFILWFAFFRVPAAPGMVMDPTLVERKILTPAPSREPRHAVR